MDVGDRDKSRKCCHVSFISAVDNKYINLII